MKKKKPKKRGRPVGTGPGKKLKVLDKTFKSDYHGQDPRMEFHGPPKDDPEKINPVPDDRASKLKFPPPKKHPTFRKTWLEFHDDVSKRENFKIGHLRSLEILCDLYVEYEDLQEFIRVKGRSYLSVGRQGEVWKFYPEVNQLSRVQAHIKEYMKMLGLILRKDQSGESGGEGETWT